MSLQQAAYFCATNRVITDRNRVGKWKHPQGIALMSLTARSAVFFIVKYISVMSNEDLMKDPAYANRIAAHQLMTQWVKDNAEDVAHTISELAPFICGECTLSGMNNFLNTVNVTFATVALEVIRVRNENGEDNTMCLPVDALEMQSTLYGLSRFLKMFSPLGYLMEKNKKMPAFQMSISAYGKIDSV